MDLGISDDVAIVTASSSGLGREAARSLASEGAHVVINGRSADSLEETRQDILADATGQVVAQAGDITEAATAEALVDTAVEEFGRIDHLVTSAGGPPAGLFLDIEDDQWYDTFDMLVMSVVRLVKESAEYLMDDGGGTIVNITSTLVKEPVIPLVLSNSIRLAVVGLSKTLSEELTPEVRTNAVMPGPFDTPRIDDIVESRMSRGLIDTYEEGIEHFEDNIPVGRVGQAEELASAIAFLCSDQASFVNGAVIPVDGGRLKSHL